MNVTVVLSRDENIQHYNATKVTIDIEEQALKQAMLILKHVARKRLQLVLLLL